MNSKSFIRIWQKSLYKEKGRLLKVTDKMRNNELVWNSNNWLKEVEQDATRNLQKGLLTGQQWIDSKIASRMNWTMDTLHDQVQTSKTDEAKITETIKILNELREKLNRVSVAANHGKAVGNSGEIVGAGVAVIGALMSFCKLPSGSDVMNVGNMVHHGGTFINNASKVIESYFSKKYLKEVHSVLKEDKEISKTMEKWSEYSKELDATVRAVFGTSQREMRNIISKVCSELYKFAPFGIGISEALDLIRRGNYVTYIGNDVQIALLLFIIMKLYYSMCASPILADKIRSVLSASSMRPENVKMFIQILIASSLNFESVVEADPKSDLETDPKAEFETDHKADLEADPKADFETDAKADLETDSKAGFVADSKADLEADFETDPKADLETDPEADLDIFFQTYSEVDIKDDLEAQPGQDHEITTANTRKLLFRAISLAYCYNSFMNAVNNILRGKSQYNNTLKRILKGLERKLKLIRKD